MEKAKIEIKVGVVEFTGEGEQDWLSEQLDKVLDKVPELLKIEMSSPPTVTVEGDNNSVAETIIETSNSNQAPSNIVSFLREKNATSNQVNKFLVTSVFLQKNGKSRISTTEVSQTLKSANQSKLANASDALNKNVRKGYCEKEGSQFFVTQEGLDFVEQLK